MCLLHAPWYCILCIFLLIMETQITEVLAPLTSMATEEPLKIENTMAGA